MGDTISVKVKGVGHLEFELTTIEKFIGDDKIVDKLEKFMGNNSGYEDEYVYLDEEYSPLIDALESKDKDVGDMVELHHFIDPTSRESFGKIDGIEVSTCLVNVPKGNDVLTFNAIETNTSGSYMLLFKQEDIAEVSKYMYEATPKDIAKLETKAKSSKSSKIIEEEIEDIELDENDEISLDDLEQEEKELDDDLDDLYSGR